MVLLLLWFWKFYSADLYRDPVLHLRTELMIWKKTLNNLQKNFNDEEGEKTVLNNLSNYIVNLEGQIQTKGIHILSIEELEEKYKVKDWELLIKSTAVLLLIIIMFFMHSMVGLELSLAWIAIIGSMLHILVSGITQIDEILEKVELSTLMFFAALFILMKSLEELSVIQFLADQMVSLISSVPEGKVRLLVAILLLLWISAFTSAFIDNIPYTVTLAPVVVQLANSGLNLPLRPLVWALSLGTCLGGNGTIIGASANVVGVGLCEREGFPVTFLTFLKMGMPVMIFTVLVSTVYLCIFNVLINWD
jgi:Na+/H+ antiporter NhaD/arsenite permease-like protein